MSLTERAKGAIESTAADLYCILMHRIIPNLVTKRYLAPHIHRFSHPCRESRKPKVNRSWHLESLPTSSPRIGYEFHPPWRHHNKRLKGWGTILKNQIDELLLFRPCLHRKNAGVFSWFTWTMWADDAPGMSSRFPILSPFGCKSECFPRWQRRPQTCTWLSQGQIRKVPCLRCKKPRPRRGKY